MNNKVVNKQISLRTILDIANYFEDYKERYEEIYRKENEKNKDKRKMEPTLLVKMDVFECPNFEDLNK